MTFRDRRIPRHSLRTCLGPHRRSYPVAYRFRPCHSYGPISPHTRLRALPSGRYRRLRLYNELRSDGTPHKPAGTSASYERHSLPRTRPPLPTASTALPVADPCKRVCIRRTTTHTHAASSPDFAHTAHPSPKSHTSSCWNPCTVLRCT